ncbi:MAG: MMPL family transporter [Gemmataceae bacterium]|nr:MMPL family transporter [Gemmataceae bacterium]MDW8267312.1 MMPL family transporter [Gemmataceae bacterium]
MKVEPVHAIETSLVARLLTGLVGLVCRWPRLVLTLGLSLAALSTYAAHTRLEYQSNRDNMAGAHKDYQQRWQKYLAEFGDDDDIVAVVQGNDRARMEEALEAIAAAVRQHPERLDRLFYKVDLRELRNRALLYLPTDQIQSIQANLKSMGLLLEFGPVSWRTLSLMSLLREARHRAGAIVPGRPLSAGDDQFFTQLVSISRSAAATVADPAAYRNPWGSLMPRPPEQKEEKDMLAEPQYFFSGDGSLAFLLVRPIKVPGSLAAAQPSVELMRRILAEVRPRFPDLELGLTGMPVLETDETIAAETDSRRAALLAIGGVSLLFLLVYRSVYYPLLTVATLLVGTAWAMGWVTLTVGHLNILSATFAAMLIGMGDYGVLWVMRYEEARRCGMEVAEALRHTAGRVAVGNLTAATTTAVAFFAAMFADFQAVAELGFIAGCGVLLCAFACFTILPAILMVADRRSLATAEATPASCGILRSPLFRFGTSLDRGWLPSLVSRPAWVVGGAAALALLVGAFGLRVRYDYNLLHLQAQDLESVQWEMKLVERTAGASWHGLSYCASADEALARKARFEQLPQVSRVVEVASLVPAEQPRKLPMLRDIQQRLRRLPERGTIVPHPRPNSAELKAELNCLLGTLQPLADASSDRLLQELRQSLRVLYDCLVNAPVVAVAEERLQSFDEWLARDLADDLHRLRDVSTPAPIAVTDLPAALRERFISPNGSWLLRVFGKNCLWDFQPLEEFVRALQTVDPEATGKPFTTVEGLRQMREGFQWAGLYAFVAIVLVLGADYRSLRMVLLALVPLALGLVVSLGIMGIFNLPLNPANMIALPLILGVGVDNGVHVLHDYLLRRAEGRRTISCPIGRGVLVKALTTMIGFGMLMICRQRGLVGLGLILTLGVGCCMVAALVFLPSVLYPLAPRRRVELPIPLPLPQQRQAA